MKCCGFEISARNGMRTVSLPGLVGFWNQFQEWFSFKISARNDRNSSTNGLVNISDTGTVYFQYQFWNWHGLGISSWSCMSSGFRIRPSIILGFFRQGFSINHF